MMVVSCAGPAVAQLAPATGVDLPAQAKGQPPAWTGPAYRQGVVSVANPHAAEAGARILEQGGNAVDAAVAIAYALNVVEPQSAGIGGGGFMMIHLARSGETFAIDSRERAPAQATPEMFKDKSFAAASTSGLAVGVPGMVRGTAMALQGWGELDLARVLQPAIDLADQGFAATPRYVSASCNARALNYPETEAFFCPGGLSRVAVGETVRNPALAETLRTIARDGADAFYRGEIARGILEGQARFRAGVAGAEPGRMTQADLDAYLPALREPVVGQYRGYTIKAMSPPSSGGLTVLQMLGMVERFPLGDAMQGFGFGSTRTLNVMAEAMRLAFADRAVWMGDADFVELPSRGLVDPDYVALRSALIDPDARQPAALPGDPRPFEPGTGSVVGALDTGEVFSGPGGSTTHFSVVDKWGNMVSYTNTIESSHGAGMFAGYYPAGCAEVACFRSLGFLLNNELTDFNFTPAADPDPASYNPGANDVAAFKRPRSSMVPTMVFDAAGRPLLAYGSPGGATIINSVFNVTLNLIDHRMTLQDAIDAPRLSVASAGGSVSVDPGAPLGRFDGFPQASLDGLRALGHTVGAVSDIGSVQAVYVEPQTGKQYGAADSRREGTVIGLPRPGGGR
ncbi:MAG: gamma-glutamyltransferase [Burkholderiales bacterium]|nr:gamma-glutamyltransferase [Burkholderiales bacterium]